MSASPEPPQTSAATRASDLAGPGSHGGAYRWQVVAMLWLVCFFNYADRQAIYAVFPLLGREFGFDAVELGLIGSAFMWVYAGGASDIENMSRAIACGEGIYLACGLLLGGAVLCSWKPASA